MAESYLTDIYTTLRGRSDTNKKFSPSLDLLSPHSFSLHSFKMSSSSKRHPRRRPTNHIQDRHSHHLPSYEGDTYEYPSSDLHQPHAQQLIESEEDKDAKNLSFSQEIYPYEVALAYNDDFDGYLEEVRLKNKYPNRHIPSSRKKPENFDHLLSSATFPHFVNAGLSSEQANLQETTYERLETLQFQMMSADEKCELSQSTVEFKDPASYLVSSEEPPQDSLDLQTSLIPAEFHFLGTAMFERSHLFKYINNTAYTKVSDSKLGCQPLRHLRLLGVPILPDPKICLSASEFNFMISPHGFVSKPTQRFIPDHYNLYSLMFTLNFDLDERSDFPLLLDFFKNAFNGVMSDVESLYSRSSTLIQHYLNSGDFSVLNSPEVLACQDWLSSISTTVDLPFILEELKKKNRLQSVFDVIGKYSVYLIAQEPSLNNHGEEISHLHFVVSLTEPHFEYSYDIKKGTNSASTKGATATAPTTGSAETMIDISSMKEDLSQHSNISSQQHQTGQHQLVHVPKFSILFWKYEMIMYLFSLLRKANLEKKIRYFNFDIQTHFLWEYYLMYALAPQKSKVLEALSWNVSPDFASKQVTCFEPMPTVATVLDAFYGFLVKNRDLSLISYTHGEKMRKQKRKLEAEKVLKYYQRQKASAQQKSVDGSPNQNQKLPSPRGDMNNNNNNIIDSSQPLSPNRMVPLTKSHSRSSLNAGSGNEIRPSPVEGETTSSSFDLVKDPRFQSRLPRFFYETLEKCGHSDEKNAEVALNDMILSHLSTGQLVFPDLLKFCNYGYLTYSYYYRKFDTFKTAAEQGSLNAPTLTRLQKLSNFLRFCDKSFDEDRARVSQFRTPGSKVSVDCLLDLVADNNSRYKYRLSDPKLMQEAKGIVRKWFQERQDFWIMTIRNKLCKEDGFSSKPLQLVIHGSPSAGKSSLVKTIVAHAFAHEATFANPAYMDLSFSRVQVATPNMNRYPSVIVVDEADIPADMMDADALHQMLSDNRRHVFNCKYGSFTVHCNFLIIISNLSVMKWNTAVNNPTFNKAAFLTRVHQSPYLVKGDHFPLAVEEACSCTDTQKLALDTREPLQFGLPGFFTRMEASYMFWTVALELVDALWEKTDPFNKDICVPLIFNGMKRSWSVFQKLYPDYKFSELLTDYNSNTCEIKTTRPPSDLILRELGFSFSGSNADGSLEFTPLDPDDTEEKESEPAEAVAQNNEKNDEGGEISYFFKANS